MMKLALVYDRVNKIGGAERILVALHEIWPEAPLYTAVYNPQTAPWARDFKVIPSFLQKFPLAKTQHELYPWLTPLAFESFNLDEYNVVISVTTAEAKGIITKPKTLHICYCLTPTRYLWSHYDLYFKNGFFRWLTKPVVTYLRAWDKIAAQRPDIFVALSENVKERIKKYYGRNSVVIYPPVGLVGALRSGAVSDRFSNASVLRADERRLSDTVRHTSDSKENLLRGTPPRTPDEKEFYFLIVSRLVPYKRIDIAVEVFNKLGWPLKIIGTGSEMGKLKRMAKSNIEFLENLTDEKLLSYYQNSQALIFPGEEDLGLVPLEAQACGVPVIAYRGGGVLETVKEGVTGEFFYPQTAEALIKVLKKFDSSMYQTKACLANAEKFSKEKFLKNFKIFVQKSWKQHQKTITS